MPQDYTRNEEDGYVLLNIRLLSGTLEREVTVPFFTSSGTATEEGVKNDLDKFLIVFLYLSNTLFGVYRLPQYIPAFRSQVHYVLFF